MIFIRTCIVAMCIALCSSFATAAEPSADRASSTSNENPDDVAENYVEPNDQSAVHFDEDRNPVLVDNSKDLPARTVFIGFDKVPNAERYDIQVKPFGNAMWRKSFSFTTQEDQIRLRLTPGHYQIKTRSLEGNRKGSWGRWKEFWVHFKPVNKIIPVANAVIPPMGNRAEKLTFEWPAIPYAKFYYFQLKDQTGKELAKVLTQQTYFVSRLAVDQSYTWSITPLVNQGDHTSKDLKFTWNKFTIDKPANTLRPVMFQIDAAQKVSYYQFEFVKFYGDNEMTEPSVYDSYTPDFRIRLSAGAYEVRARAVYDDQHKSEWNAPQRFFLELPAPKLLEPRNGELVDSTDWERSKVLMRWRKFREADRYQVVIYREDGKMMVNEFVKEPRYVARLPHESTYRWKIIAYSAKEKNKGPSFDEVGRSPSSEEQAKARAIELPEQAFSINSYIKLELAKSEEPSQLYAWASHRSSMIGYAADNYDNGTQLRNSVFGGTAEMALGYWHRKTAYGFLSTASLAGYTIQNKTHTYALGSFLLGKRIKLDAERRLRLWAGLTYRETPEIQSDIGATNFFFTKLGGYGPEVRGSYMFNMYEKYGGHLFGQISMIPWLTTTPNDLPGVNAIAYGFGFQGTRQLQNGWIAMAGYSYQGEEATYSSIDATGFPNSIKWSGHFLTLSLMFGLEEPLR